MKQSKLESLIEVIFNVMIGFCLSFAAGPLMYFYLNVEYQNSTNLIVTGGYTILSVARSYVIRRWFNNGLHQAAVKLAYKLKEYLTV
jgi:hypothetical protein